MSFSYRTTNRESAKATVAQLLAAGYSRDTAPVRPENPRLKPLTFRTATYRTCGTLPVFSIAWADSPRAPLPKRRKLGRQKCSTEGCNRFRHSHGLCQNCDFRKRYATEPEFRAKSIKKSQSWTRQKRETDAEWKARRKVLGTIWQRANRAKKRERRILELERLAA